MIWANHCSTTAQVPLSNKGQKRTQVLSQVVFAFFQSSVSKSKQRCHVSKMRLKTAPVLKNLLFLCCLPPLSTERPCENSALFLKEVYISEISLSGQREKRADGCTIKHRWYVFNILLSHTDVVERKRKESTQISIKLFIQRRLLVHENVNIMVSWLSVLFLCFFFNLAVLYF